MWVCQHPRSRTTATVPIPVAAMLRGQVQRQNLPRDTSKPPNPLPLFHSRQIEYACPRRIPWNCWRMPSNSVSRFRYKEDITHGFASFHTPMCFGRLGQRQPEADVCPPNPERGPHHESRSHPSARISLPRRVQLRSFCRPAVGREAGVHRLHVLR